MAAGGTPIPALGHFVWLGPRLSVLGYLSVRSALDRGGFEAIRLHHDVPALEVLHERVIGQRGHVVVEADR
ncbi:MAG: hypothetical protein AAFR95_13605, partial [Bacteroidota bacterium]